MKDYGISVTFDTVRIGHINTSLKISDVINDYNLAKPNEKLKTGAVLIHILLTCKGFPKKEKTRIIKEIDAIFERLQSEITTKKKPSLMQQYDHPDFAGYGDFGPNNH